MTLLRLAVPDVQSEAASQAETAEHEQDFALIYERYHPRVYRYLRARDLPPEDARDLTQQTFVQVLRALPGYRAGKAPFAAWLFRIARNLATDAFRRKRSESAIEVATGIVDGEWNPPETAALENERLASLRRLVAELDEGKREMVALRFAGGLSSREIGVLVGKSEAAVKKQLTRTIQSLKEQYRDESLPY